MLPMAQRLANLSEEEKLSLERPEYSYGVGWSHGKEMFNGEPDFLKVRSVVLL